VTAQVLPDDLVVSAKERAQWMLHRLAAGRGICNIGMAIRVDRPLRWWPLQEALNHLLRRHPALRAVLHVEAGVPRKRFLPEDEPFPLATVSATEDTVGDLLGELVGTPLELDGQPLARGHLIMLPGASVVCLVMHHLVCDYTSAAVLLDELTRLYDSYAETERPCPELAGTARLHLEPAPDPAAVDYWVGHLSGVDPRRMALATARPITGRPTFAGDRLRYDMSAAALAALARLRKETGLTENMVLLAAYYLVLARHGAGPDVVVGVPVNARRGLPATQVGFHVSTMPIRVRVDDGLTAEQLVRRVSAAFLSGLEHSQAAFETVQDRLAERSEDWRVPLFRHMFNFWPLGGGPGLTMAGADVTIVNVHNGMSRLDLEFVVRPRPSSCHIATVYSTEVHDRPFVADLMARYDATVVGLADRLGEPIGAVTGRSRPDEEATRRRNATTRSMPARSLPAAVRQHALDTPDAPALRVGPTTIRYDELVARAGRVRAMLAGHGVRPGDTVALLAPRGPALAAAVLGVWAAGAAYLPLDPGHPAGRLAYQVADSGARCVLGDGTPDPAVLAGRECLPIGPTEPPAPQPDTAWLDPRPDQPAYVIYTSGSTGAPKGVEVTHRGLANLVCDFVDRLGATPDDRTLWLTTFAFDISALELLVPLVSGGCAVVAPDADRVDPARLLELVVREDCTIVQATPTTWRYVAGELTGQLAGRRVLCGGEALDAALANRLLAGGCRLFNVYGPTETTIWSTTVELTAPLADPVPIGSPVANTTVHVLDPAGRPVPPGVPGELCIGGAGVARGYRNKPMLSAERFVDHPGLGRYYRTGDQVREVGDQLIFLGRQDRQVKVRGHRVELTEVEAVLNRHPEVRAAAVLAEADGTGGARLVAAVQPAPDRDSAASRPGAPDLAARVRDHLAAHLPPGALPSRYVVLAELPETGNGKLDLPALADVVARTAEPVALPDDPTLRRVVTAWREVLHDDRLAPDANFFLSGGHSLLAARLAARLAGEFDVAVEFDAVFDAPTPEAFVRWLAARTRPSAGPRTEPR
jgi:amino acid adenylation domain-containing protein